jgi:hypothetical protein
VGGPKADCWAPRHRVWSSIGQDPPPTPNFKLMGVAIGNGLTDPTPQTRALASK